MAKFAVLFAAFLALSQVLETHANEVIEGGVQQIGGINYHFANWADETYADAAAECGKLSMQLAVFETEQEYMDVKNWINTNQDYDYWMWIGAVRSAGTSNFFWESTGTDISYSTAWISGQPDVPEDTMACINFSATGGGWDDDLCDRTMSFLCEETPAQ